MQEKMRNNTNGSSHISVNYYSEAYITWSVVFLVVGILIAVLNIITIIVFILYRNLRRRAVYCLINLAVADMLYGVSKISFEVIYLCKLDIAIIQMFVYVAFTITLLSSLMSLVFVSLDRVCATFFPFRHRTIQLRTYIIIFVVIWLICVLQTIALNHIINETPLLFYAVYLTVFLLCLVIICASYGAILVRVKIQARRARQQQLGPATQLRQKREQHLAMTLFIVTILSLITWAPYLSALFTITILRIKTPFNTHQVLMTFQRMNSLINPIVYVFRMHDFRKALMQLIFRCSYTRSQRQVHAHGNHSRQHELPTLELEHVQ